MPEPLFTIITATFNVRRAIDIAADSVRTQRRSDIEYIVIDGASTDDTLEHVVRNQDVVTRFISEPDSGIYDALNKGIAMARGELIGIIGADDSLLYGALNTVARYHQDAPADIYAGQTLITTSEGRWELRRDEEYGVAALACSIPFGHNAMFARRSAYLRIGVYDLSYRIAADANWVHRAIKAGLSCTRIPRVLTQFSPSGLSTVDKTGIIDETGRAISENFPYLSREEAVTCLNCIRGWDDASGLVPILTKHNMTDLFEALSAAFRNRPHVWASITEQIKTRTIVSASAPAFGPKATGGKPVRTRCKKPIFSFVIPAYNVETYIGRCLESILSQPLENIEVIVVDDGSTDGTSSVVQRYRASDERVQLFRQENSGQGVARNFGLCHTTGNFVWFVDSDDRIQSNVLHRMNSIFAQTLVDVLVLNYAYENEDGTCEYSANVSPATVGKVVNPLVEESVFASVSAWSCPPWRYVIRRDFLESTGITFPPFSFAEDHPFAIDLITSTNKVYVDSTISYYYLRRKGSSVHGALGNRRVFGFLAIRRLVIDILSRKKMLERLPSVAISYILPISFVKAHVGIDHRQEFLTRLVSDMQEEEVSILRAFGGFSELEFLAALDNGALTAVNIDGLTSVVDQIWQHVEVSRTLKASDVQGLSFTEGPYPELGIPTKFSWVEGHTLAIRLKSGGIANPKLLLRYRNALPEQHLTIEQNNTLIESFPCRTVGLEHVSELRVPVLRSAEVVVITITARLTCSHTPRRLSIAVEQIDVIDGDVEVEDDRISGSETVLKELGSNIDGLRVDIRRDIQPRTYVRIGKESHIAGTFVFELGIGQITIGDRCSIGYGCLLICSQQEGISIGNNVMLSWGVTVIDTDSHSHDPDVRANDAFDWLVGSQTGHLGLYKDWVNVRSKNIVIKDGAWIGFGSTILKGVTIGVGSIVGCNSVVTKDVPDYTKVAGNPARVIGQVPRTSSDDELFEQR